MQQQMNEYSVQTISVYSSYFCFSPHPWFCTTAGANMDEETGKSFARRDWLLEIESQVQKWWEDGDVFRADAKDSPPKPCEKFFGNLPFPYMNGTQG